MKRLACLAFVLGLSAATTSAHAAWAVAQGNAQPIVARNYSSVFDAKQQALRDCNRQFGHCEVKASSQNGCLAIASAGKAWGIGKGTKSQARAAAQDICQATSVSGCKVIHEFCGR